MNILQRWRARRAAAVAAGEPAPASVLPEVEREVDLDTGEILGPSARAPRSDPAIAGERGIPSVHRERSVRSRVSNALAFATVVVVGLGFLFWYYATQYSRNRDAQVAARQADEARAAGELRLPPLGRIDPPKGEAANETVLGAPPPVPPPAAPPAPAGPPVKTPQQLALERQLGQPVLLHAPLMQRVGANAQEPAPFVPSAASLLAGMQAAAAPPSPEPPPISGLGALLRPTPTPAVAAEVLPTQRFLLPKGAFVDCTLETAIDSTLDGMVTCIGATDVYSADGKVILLERGTKYVGEKRGELRQGQGRVFVLWNEARTPTGVVVNLTSPGTDELGRSGLPGFVDTHFWDRFGAAILISVIDGVLQALANSQQNGGGNTAVVINPQGGRDVMTEVLRDTVAIPPTVVKNQGDRIQVLVARDVDFRGVYALRIQRSHAQP